MGDDQGLRHRCANANLVGRSSRKDQKTLTKKFYLLEVKNDREAAVEFGQSRKLPDGINLTGVAIYDILFRVERFALMLRKNSTKPVLNHIKTQHNTSPQPWRPPVFHNHAPYGYGSTGLIHLPSVAAGQSQWLRLVASKTTYYL